MDATTAGRDGGAVLVRSESSLVLQDMRITNAVAGESGGAVMLTGLSVGCVSGMELDTVKARTGGGIAVGDRAQLAIRDTTITSGRATVNGGCMSYEGARQLGEHLTNPLMGAQCAGMTADVEDVTADACVAVGIGGAVFMSNSAVRTAQFTAKGSSAKSGGGIAMASSTIGMTAGTLDENAATILGGGIYAVSSQLEMQGVTVSDNTAQAGAGVSADASDVVLTGATHFFRNDATEEGGGLALSEGDLEMHGCTFESNTAGRGGGVAARHSSILATASWFTGNTCVWWCSGVWRCVCVCV